MTTGARLITTVNHETPDRLCVDLGAGGQAGIGATALHHLQQSDFSGYYTVHSIQSNVPVENILLHFRAVNDARTFQNDL